MVKATAAAEAEGTEADCQRGQQRGGYRTGSQESRDPRRSVTNGMACTEKAENAGRSYWS